ncbi:MAG: hypothetical protein ABFR32_08570 [Bacteroidota bacterium]
MYKKIYTTIIFIIFSTIIYSQDNWMLKGYVKGMTAMQTIDDGGMSIENTLHNRFDLNWYINENFTFSTGLRNRIIAGNNVILIPNYANYVGRDVGYFDMSWVWADEKSWIGVSQLDRLKLDYTVGNFQITLGRQRINWGQTFVWNPNDLFNTYSYFDFDYEEKPGSDAVRLQYYIGESSKIELSTSINSDDKVTSALLYRFNTHGYDIQFLGGVFTESDYVIGGGWSGSIAGGGFSGEFTYYHPMENNSETDGAVTATIHYDYTFSNSLNLQFETLYNGFGADDMEGGLGEVIFMDLSPKNLFPTKVALFGSGGYQLSPLIYLMLAGMYGPEGNFVYFGPTLSYSLSDTMELAVIGQYYSMDELNDFDGNSLPNSGSALFIRLKWAF